MKFIHNTHRVLTLALLASCLSAQAKLIWFDDMENLFDDMRALSSRMEHEFKRMEQSARHFGPNKEAYKQLKEAEEQLLKIKPVVTGEGDTVIITFPIESVDKTGIDLEPKDNAIQGTIPTQWGNVTFTITPQFIQYGYQVELKKEEKTDAAVDEKEVKKAHVSSYQFASHFSYSDLLPATVEIDAQAIDASTNEKEKKFIIKLPTKKIVKLPVRHE